MKKKYKVIILVLIIVMCICMMFTGCSFVSPNIGNEVDIGGEGSSEGSGEGGGSGSGSGSQTAQIVPNKFKMGYRGTAQDSNVEENIKTLAETLVEDFASTFGAGNGYSTQENDYTNVYYYDSIRYQAYEEPEDDETIIYANVENAWAWSFVNKADPLYIGAANYRGVLLDAYNSAIGTTYQTDKNKNDYKSFYKTLYSEAMEVVLYEILLGKTDYDKMIVVGDNFDANGYPVVTYRGQSVSVVEGKLDFSSILTTLKAEYFDKATYFGFSVSDGTKIKNYIINYVIGESAHKDKNGADQLDDNRHYNDYVQALVDGLINSQTEYYWYARTGFKDGRLAISSTGDYFQLVPRAEYQSLVLMAEEEDEFISCRIALWSDVNVSGKVMLRYYDGYQCTILSTQNILIKANGKDDDCIVSFNLGSTCNIDLFGNNEDLFAATEQVNQKVNPIYKPVNLNGSVATVFNEDMADGKFIELVFIIEETTVQNNNYSGFKVVFLDMELATNNIE